MCVFILLTEWLLLHRTQFNEPTYTILVRTKEKRILFSLQSTIKPSPSVFVFFVAMVRRMSSLLPFSSHLLFLPFFTFLRAYLPAHVIQEHSPGSAALEAVYISLDECPASGMHTSENVWWKPQGLFLFVHSISLSLFLPPSFSVFLLGRILYKIVVSGDFAI